MWHRWFSINVPRSGWNRYNGVTRHSTITATTNETYFIIIIDDDNGHGLKERMSHLVRGRLEDYGALLLLLTTG
jgi:hypothetical protein